MQNAYVKHIVYPTLAILLMVTAGSAAASPPQQKFFPLNREKDQKGVEPAAKFFPINQKKPMKLVFAPSKKPIIYSKDKQQAKPLKLDAKQPTTISGGDASQLLSIYESVD